jgi:histidine triad (HIT) family protein
MNNCIFCKIVKGKLPCYKVYDDDNFLAFLDIFPLAEGHTLVIPKKHYRWVWDVENIGEYFTVCQTVAHTFQKTSGVELVVSMTIGNEVPHPHIHLVPGFNEQQQNQLVTNMLSSKKSLSDETAQELLKKIKPHLSI